MRGAGVFERGTYSILGVITAVMGLWMAIPALVGVPFEQGSGHWVEWVGGATPDTLFGELHRLLTASTAHFGLSHLLINLVLLWIAGLSIARLNSPWIIPVSFIVSGMAGTAATLGLHGGYALGASAGIFGIFGSVVSRLPATESSHVWPARFLVSGVVLGLGATGDGELVAHWGGFFAGVLVGLIPWTASSLQRSAWACVSLWGVCALVHWSNLLL